MLLLLLPFSLFTIPRSWAVVNRNFPFFHAGGIKIGSGGASKEQVAMMVAAELGIGIERIPLDSTDALALAICHAQLLLRPGLSVKLGKPL